MDYNATTPLAPEVIQTVTKAMHEAWGNPSSSYTAGKSRREWKQFRRGGAFIADCPLFIFIAAKAPIVAMKTVHDLRF